MPEPALFTQTQKEPVGKCPKCGAEVIERAKSYSCTKCDFVLWKEVFGSGPDERT